MTSKHRWCIGVLCACLGATTLAADVPTPTPQKQGAVTFVTGGIGLDEADALRTAAGQYNLRITFSTQSGQYYAGVKTTLRDAQGRTVIETVSDGPFVFFNVEPGKYEVIAENLGQTITRTARVREKRGTELYIRWRAPVEEHTE